MSRNPRFIVGIDLGTSTCSLAYFDSLHPQLGIRILPIPQWVGEGQWAELPLLPSFCYLPEKSLVKNRHFSPPFLPHSEVFTACVLGVFARQQMGLAPDRVVHGAKSWLSYGAVDRHAKILPWQSSSITAGERLSPVAVSALYLRYLAAIWDQHFAEGDPQLCLAQQQLVITLPASFDEVASSLTLAAALAAGLPGAEIALLEEPLAAFYCWQFAAATRENPDATQAHPWGFSQGDYWRVVGELGLENKARSSLVLVCDMGGGTTDFSLLRVEQQGETSNELSVERLEVSSHILLGGDNIDLQLAHSIAQQRTRQATALSPWAWAQLLAEARNLKEKAFSSLACGEEDQEYRLGFAGEGARLFAEAQSLGLGRDAIIALILEGFFPLCARTARPQHSAATLHEWGLPYAYDSALTHHLAGFLRGRAVDGVLFSGGSLRPALLRERLVNLLNSWQDYPLRQLLNPHYELAVSQGAAIYGACRRYGTGRITAGYPRTLYLEVEQGAKNALESAGDAAQEKSLLCLLPRGFASLQPLAVSLAALHARVGQAVAFTLYSSTRALHQAGEVLSVLPEDLQRLPSLSTSLVMSSAARKKTGDLLEVGLEVLLTETGLVQLYCLSKESSDRWQLTFRVEESNSAAGTSLAPSSVEAFSLPPEVGGLIQGVFGKKELPLLERLKPQHLWQGLSKALAAEKSQWSLGQLRAMSDLLQAGETRRGRSLQHEISWLSLAGFCLRPGYGLAGDSFRIERLWQAYGRGLFFPQEKRGEEQWWIMWRRVAGGLEREWQEKLYNKLFPQLRQGQAGPEAIRLLGSLERLDVQKKQRLGGVLLEHIVAGKSRLLEQKLWALSRVASRSLLYAGPESIVPPQVVEAWFREISRLPRGFVANGLLLSFIVASGRRVELRDFDISAEARELFIAELVKNKASPGQIKVLEEYIAADRGSMEQLFGEQLPPGLLIVSQ